MDSRPLTHGCRPLGAGATGWSRSQSGEDGIQLLILSIQLLTLSIQLCAESPKSQRGGVLVGGKHHHEETSRLSEAAKHRVSMPGDCSLNGMMSLL